jgi:hypothetical protein
MSSNMNNNWFRFHEAAISTTNSGETNWVIHLPSFRFETEPRAQLIAHSLCFAHKQIQGGLAMGAIGCRTPADLQPPARLCASPKKPNRNACTSPVRSPFPGFPGFLWFSWFSWFCRLTSDWSNFPVFPHCRYLSAKFQVYSNVLSGCACRKCSRTTSDATDILPW